MIVQARPPKRQRRPKPRQPALAAAIVTTRKGGPKPVPDDPEADTRAMAWIVAQLRPAARHLMSGRRVGRAEPKPPASRAGATTGKVEAHEGRRAESLKEAHHEP